MVKKKNEYDFYFILSRVINAEKKNPYFYRLRCRRHSTGHTVITAPLTVLQSESLWGAITGNDRSLLQWTDISLP